MALSLKTAGTWARVVTDPSSVTIPGSPASGDRMFLFATWKTYTITVGDPSGWTPIGSVYADGTTAAGIGTGSMAIHVWYRDWVTADANPSLDWSASPTEAHAVIQLWTKASGDTWGTPARVNGAIAAADPFTVNASATVTVPDMSVVMAMIGIADDSATMTRATDAIDDTGALVTWNGSYVESPATHATSTTGQDNSAELGHRFVTVGSSGVTLHADGDQSAADSGACSFIVQGLAAATTGVAEVSLASAATPSDTTFHKFHVRARVTTATGFINLALYEGSTNRSGDLSTRLTTSLADYTLPIGSTEAEDITDYSNLGVRFWGTAYGAVAFEVDQIWLEILESGETTGTFAGTVAGPSSAFTGNVLNPVTGTFASTVAGPSSSWTGAETLTGTFASTVAGPSGSFTGTHVQPVTGTFASTVAGPSGAFTAAETLTGTFASTAPSPTGSFTGSSIEMTTGTFTGTAPSPTGAFTASQSIPGTFAGTVAGPSSAWTGNVVNPVTGTFAGTVAGPTGSFTGISAIAVTGTLAGTVAGPTGAFTGTHVQMVTGTFASTVAGPVSAWSGLESITGTLAASTPVASAAFTGAHDLTITGIFDSTVAGPTASFTGQGGDLFPGTVIGTDRSRGAVLVTAGRGSVEGSDR